MTPHAAALLRGLGHPSPDAPGDLKTVVEWLEHSKIRRYAPANRAPLTSPASEAEWRGALGRYLADVGCPHPPTGADAAVADWLAGHAVALAAADAGEGVADATAARVAAGRDVLDAADAAAAGVVAPAFADAGAEDTLAALHDLSSALGVTAQSAGDPAALADACVAALTDRVLPAAALLGAGAPSADPALALLASVPLGFTTGDAGVDRAAAALRFLYVRDLAALQARVDAAIGAVQAFTANPRTDTRLGKVGR